ncbi:hypothetical protein QR680_004613 [Steinernema hermaphroditum]|uniref:Uncharacterized protein n=1 Tax=Steinernema hermaphroditum TaxID=289476 RepID=A0AA39HP98_9BILA|nr:hypothetical protein QR680_004613 [Steinernema hermaphroditum]
MDPSIGKSVGMLINSTDSMLLNLTGRVLTASTFLSYAFPIIVILLLVLVVLVNSIIACYAALFIRVFFEAKKHNHDMKH